MALRPRLASASPLTGNRPAAFRRALLHWFDRNGRDLPWRESHDPYRIWLSEIMLQQTRVAAVLEHYRIFLERFPNVQALAESSEDTVLAAWSGLGYYRRARRLHRCAQAIVQKYAGQFPRNSDALLALPGIGRYTSAAIASIAFGEPIAVVDGNVERVLQRLFSANLDAPQTWLRAQALLDTLRSGDFNQAMMELGATVCVPRAPRCQACPVQKWCASRGEVARGPGGEHSPAARQSKKQIWCALDWRDGEGKGSNNNKDRGPEVRLVQRSRKDSLMPGMWELPQTSAYSSRLSPQAYWRTFRHSITVTDYTVHVLRNTELPAARGRWISIDRLPQIPITGLTRKILKAGGII